MADLVPKTIKFRTDQESDLLKDCGQYDLCLSDLVRHHCRVSGPLTRACPQILELDDKKLSDVMEKVGKILVILGYV